MQKATLKARKQKGRINPDLDVELKANGALTISERDPDNEWESEFVYLSPSQTKQLKQFLKGRG